MAKTEESSPPIPQPRCILIHTRLGDPTSAHCFGPFETYQEALAFDDESKDDCAKIILPLVGPSLDDIGRMELFEATFHDAHHEEAKPN